MTGRPVDERWAAVDAAVDRFREQQTAEAWLCGELLTDDYPHEPPPPVVRNCIRDLADYQA